MKLSNKTLDLLKNNPEKKVVFTNGCFDILHRGHVTYLNQAKALGDLLIVGLNSDHSVKRLKGETRPIHSEEDRRFVLENLKSVDSVEIFDQDTPLELIQVIRPHILVKGGDWQIDQIVGAKEVISWGGEVRPLTFVEGHSTTKIIEKARSN